MPELLKSQKNELFELLKYYKLSPSDFRWSNYPNLTKIPIRASGSRYPVLFYGTGDDLFFQFQITPQFTGSSCVYAPGDNRPLDQDYTSSWYEIKRSFELWARFLRKEIDTPDLWESISQEKQFIQNASTSSDDSVFTQAEQKHLATSLNEIKQYLLTALNVNETNQQFITVRMQYLQDASTRLSKKDWKNIAVGTLMGLIVDLTLDPQKAKELFRLAGNALSWLLTHGPSSQFLP